MRFLKIYFSYTFFIHEIHVKDTHLQRFSDVLSISTYIAFVEV